MARIYKRCECPERAWKSCAHAWVVRYRTPGGRASNQREQSFTAKREADDFALKVEHDKRAHVFIDPRGGQALFRVEAETWLNRHLGADNSITTYRSVLRAHVLPAIGGKRLAAVRRDDIKTLIAAMRAKGLSASRIRAAHLVISASSAKPSGTRSSPNPPASRSNCPASSSRKTSSCQRTPRPKRWPRAFPLTGRPPYG